MKLTDETMNQEELRAELIDAVKDAPSILAAVLILATDAGSVPVIVGELSTRQAMELIGALELARHMLSTFTLSAMLEEAEAEAQAEAKLD